MAKIDQLIKDLEKETNRVNAKKEKAKKSKEDAELVKEKAEEDIKAADEAKIDEDYEITEEAKEKVDEAEKAHNEVVSKNSNKKKKIIISITSGLLAALTIGGIVHFITKESKKGKIVSNAKESTSSVDDRLLETDASDLTVIIETKVSLKDDDTVDSPSVKETETKDLSNDKNYVELTEENFESLVGTYVTKNASKYSNISTEDILKYVALANIDEISENNSELASQLFNSESKEEFLNDAAKVIGATVMYDFNVWNQTNSTKDFIKVSDSIIGSQKEQMIKIEEYVNKIADAVNANDKNLVNTIITEFLEDMNSGDLSKLDDGVGFSAQVYIALISDGIAKDYLNQENFDMLQILKTSEKYISNIFAVYEKCNGGKSLSR